MIDLKNKRLLFSWPLLVLICAVWLIVIAVDVLFQKISCGLSLLSEKYSAWSESFFLQNLKFKKYCLWVFEKDIAVKEEELRKAADADL